ncbi:ion channel [Paracoccus nototheniae]|uniref:ion channel n=1 Tax=Paracoccus nototheniae TaxID=2489002 RepID=UPI001038DBAF|nr:ion channel [Paracoccus nototheniae]
MLGQIAFGSGLMIVSVLTAGLGIWGLETAFARGAPWLARAPHRPKLALVIVAVSLAVLGMVTASVWLWAGAFHLLGVFASFEESMYFALVTFTTLGFGDVLLAQDWRIMGAMAAANGLLHFGLMTAFMVEALRHVRVRQIEFTKG